MNWYVVHTYSGFEEKVKQSLESKIEQNGLHEQFGRILVPAEKVIDVRGGKKKESEKKFYPGYILVEMDLNDETWHIIKSVPRVSGFVGGTKPVPVAEEEVEQIITQMEKGPAPEVKAHFVTGDSVRITDGPFSNFTGYVEEVDVDHARLRVMVSIFGRLTPVELHFSQVEKAS